jgi:hypothetical protein
MFWGLIAAVGDIHCEQMIPQLRQYLPFDARVLLEITTSIQF